MERLRELGYPVQAAMGAGGGYRLVAGTAMPPLLLDDEEAVAIAAGLRTAAASASTSRPQTVACPASGRSEVDKMETAVVLPDPFGPSRPSTDPAGTWKLRPSRATT